MSRELWAVSHEPRLKLMAHGSWLTARGSKLQHVKFYITQHGFPCHTRQTSQFLGMMTHDIGTIKR